MDVLLDVLKWSAVVGAAALALTLLKPLLDRRYSARWRYWVWLAMAALLLLAPVQWEALAPQTETAPPVVIEVPRMELRFSREEGIALQRPAEAASIRPAAPVDRADSAPAPEAAKSWSLSQILPLLWLAGAVVYAAYRLLGTVFFVHRAKRWSRSADENTTRVFEEVRQDLELKRIPVLRVSTRVESPMMVGLFRPCLLLPGENYGERELPFILRHELCHYRRRDLWYKLILLVANAVHWFNPLVYLLVREAEADLELTCDDLVVRGADGETRRAYSETLLAAVRRQKGLSRSALSTHFYGGAAVMKERLGNILGKRGRKWGVLALVLALAVIVTCACAFGLKQQEEKQTPENAVALDAGELAQWQERLNSQSYNGFLTRMYTDVRYLPLEDLFYNGAGISRNATEEERAALEAQTGQGIEVDVDAITVADMDAYLEEYTGLTRADFSGSKKRVLYDARGRNWTELDSEDTYFNIHGDTTFTPVTVLSGSQSGDTVSLEVMAGADDWILSFASGETRGILTIQEGKIRSFTTPLYSEAEAAAWEMMEQTEEELRSAQRDIRISDRYLTDLRATYVCEYGDREYSVWYPCYQMKLAGGSDGQVAGSLELEDGWINQGAARQAKGVILSEDGEGNVNREEIFEDTMGYTLQGYVICHAALGMELAGRLGDCWPEATGTFIRDVSAGHNTWAMSWEGTALQYAQDVLGETPLADGILRIMDFQPLPDPVSTPSTDNELLVQVSCEGGDWLLMLYRYDVDGQTFFYQVHGAVPTGEAALDIQQALAYLEEYFTARMEEDPAAALKFMHFEDSSEAEAYARVANSTKDYHILSAEKISTAVCAFYIEFDRIDISGEDTIEYGYNFVAIIDGEYRVMNNIRHVPHGLFHGDRSKYSNDTENSIGPAGYLGRLETSQDYMAMYALWYAQGLADELERQGVETTGTIIRSGELVGTYTWDHYDSELQVWKVEYGIQLADPDSYQPVGRQAVDENGYLSGLEGDTPYLILVKHPGEDAWNLAETAYERVEWEYDFHWETWVLAHTVHGLDMSPKLNAWPELIHSDFVLEYENGEHPWAAEWETTARQYLKEELGLEDCVLSQLATVETGDQGPDQDMLVTFDSGDLSGMLLLSHWNFQYANDSRTANIWEVTGRKWQEELTEEELAEFAAYFNDREHNGLLRFPYDNVEDIGPYLDWLFYDMDGDAAAMTGEEREAAGLGGEFDARKLTSRYVVDYLFQNFGFDASSSRNYDYEWLEQMFGKENLDRLGTYLPEYDAWYSERSDAAWQAYTFQQGWRYLDGSVRLDFTPDYTAYIGANGIGTTIFGRSMYALVQSGDDSNRYMLYNRFGYQ